MSGRRAFTLVEAAVFSLIGMVVMVAVFVIFRNTQREATKTGVHLRGIQAAFALMERLSLDLRGGMFFESPFIGQPFQLKVLDDGRTVEFPRFDPLKAQAVPPDSGSALSLIPVQQVRYTFDPASGRVTRRIGSGRPDVLTTVRYLDVSFRRDPPPSPPVPGAPPVDNLLRVKIQWVPEERAKLPPKERGEVMTVVAALGLDGEAVMRQHPHRILNPTSKFAVEPIGP